MPAIQARRNTNRASRRRRSGNATQTRNIVFGVLAAVVGLPFGYWAMDQLSDVSQRLSLYSDLSEARDNAGPPTKTVVLTQLNGKLTIELPTDYSKHGRPKDPRQRQYSAYASFSTDTYEYKRAFSSDWMMLGYFKGSIDALPTSFTRDDLRKANMSGMLSLGEPIDLKIETDRMSDWNGLPMRVVTAIGKERGRQRLFEFRVVGHQHQLFMLFAVYSPDMKSRGDAFLNSLEFTPPFQSKPADSTRPAFTVTAGGPPTNVSTLIDPTRDATVGQWIAFENGVASPQDIEGAILTLPVEVPDAYELSMTVQRAGGSESFNLGLPIGNSMANVVIDGFAKPVSGLSMVDSMLLTNRPEAVKGQQIGFTPVHVIAQVRSDSIKVTCGSKTIVDWQGDSSSLTTRRNYWDYESNRLFIGSWSSEFIVRDIQLVRLK